MKLLAKEPPNTSQRFQGEARRWLWGMGFRERRGRKCIQRLLKFLPASFVVLICACSGNSWNNPYPAKDVGKNILYSAFAERPKHLDPVQSYSSNEILWTAQIYESPLQYH